MASAAPVPSPSRSPRSSSGSLPKRACMARCPGSALRWAAMTYSAAAGQRAWASRAPAVEMKPSTTTGFRRAAAAEHHAGDAADLEAADLGQHVQASLRIGPVDAQCLFDDGDLAGQLAVVDAGAAAGQVGDRQSGQCGQHGGGRRGVGDAHVAGAEHVGGVGQPSTTSMPASMDRTACSRVMAGPTAILAVPGAIFLSMILPALASGPKSAATPMSTTTTRAPASRARALMPAMPADEAVDHLRRDFLGILAHALGRHAVIAGHGDDRLPRRRRMQRAGHAGQVHGQVHQPPQGPMRHDELIQPLLGLAHARRRLGGQFDAGWFPRGFIR